MVKIRLMRMGKKKQPYFRVVVADARSPRDGRFIENIGKYHPRAHPSVIEVDRERALHWLRSGAQPSDAVKVLLEKTGIWAEHTGEAPPAPPEPAAPEEEEEEGPEPGEGEEAQPMPTEEEVATEPGESEPQTPTPGSEGP